MKIFCPNCEKETNCTHEANLFACDECGEDFAMYIVSRNPVRTDDNETQNTLKLAKLNARISELEKEIALLQDKNKKLRRNLLNIVNCVSAAAGYLEDAQDE